MKPHILPLSALLLALPTAGLFGTTYTNSSVNATTLNTAGNSADHTKNILDGSLTGDFAFGDSSTDVYVGSTCSYIDLSILKGGSVTGNYGYIGYGDYENANYGCYNSVTITGTGSNDTSTNWTNDGDFYVGYLGSSNALSISDGADITNATCVIGNGDYYSTSLGSNNSATITGAGSTWTNSEYLCVGNYGSSNTLSISAGAVVTDKDGYIGYGGDDDASTGSNNGVTITGTGSNDTSTKWTNSGNLSVGQYGSSNTLSISAGADVTNTNGYIGYAGTSNSNSVTITGKGSTWINSGSLTIGQTGNTGNTLTIDDGAMVQVGGTISITSGNYIYLGSGYLAVAGNYTSGGSENGSLATLLSGIQIYNSSTDSYSSATTSNTYLVYITADIAAAYEAALGYSDLTGYTIFSSSLIVVPEPAAFALFGGLGVLGLALFRRRAR